MNNLPASFIAKIDSMFHNYNFKVYLAVDAININYEALKLRRDLKLELKELHWKFLDFYILEENKYISVERRLSNLVKK